MNNNLIEELYNKIEDQDKIINEQVLEIAELNESITWWQNRFHAVERNNRKLKEVIDKAIKYIEDWLFDAGGNGASMTYEDINELLDILKEVKS